MQERYETVLPIGVGLYEKTPAANRKVGIAYTTWNTATHPRWGAGTWDLPLDGPYISEDPAIIRYDPLQPGAYRLIVTYTLSTDDPDVTIPKRQHASVLYFTVL